MKNIILSFSFLVLNACSLYYVNNSFLFQFSSDWTGYYDRLSGEQLNHALEPAFKVIDEYIMFKKNDTEFQVYTMEKLLFESQTRLEFTVNNAYIGQSDLRGKYTFEKTGFEEVTVTYEIKGLFVTYEKATAVYHHYPLLN